MISSPPDSSPPTTAQLVQSAQNGDRQALGDLLERFQSQVLCVARRRLRNEHEAQELSQEVFLQVIQKLAQLRQPEAFPGWLRSITNRMAINRIVRRKPDSATEPELLDGRCVDSQTPDGQAIAAERAAVVHDGLQRLRAMDRETLVAFYVRGHSLLEMSDQFEAPLGTIKRRLHVARQRLAEEVEPLVSV